MFRIRFSIFGELCDKQYNYSGLMEETWYGDRQNRVLRAWPTRKGLSWIHFSYEKDYMTSVKFALGKKTHKKQTVNLDQNRLTLVVGKLVFFVPNFVKFLHFLIASENTLEYIIDTLWGVIDVVGNSNYIWKRKINKKGKKK